MLDSRSARGQKKHPGVFGRVENFGDDFEFI